MDFTNLNLVAFLKKGILGSLHYLSKAHTDTFTWNLHNYSIKRQLPFCI